MASEATLRTVTLTLCAACLSGAGGECHTPGCAFWMNRAPDIPVTLSDDGSCGRLLVGHGTDTWDPLCVLPAGHSGSCEPETIRGVVDPEEGGGR